MERVLHLAKIEYKKEVKFRRFHVDFLVENYKTAIECDGEYWHLRPEIQDRDRRKEELLASLGYKVFRFSGKIINKYSENELARILSENFYSYASG